MPSGCAARSSFVPVTRNAPAFDPAAKYHFPIRHVVIIFQENRTPDNLFQGLPGADIASSGLNDRGRVVALHAVPLTAKYDLQHEHSGFVVEYDGGKMDGWSLEHSSNFCKRRDKRTCAYAYVPRSENRPYVTMAKQYAFADRMFQSNQGPSYPAHQFIVSGDSAGLPKSSLNVSSNPLDHGEFHGSGGGCDAPSWERVLLINPRGFQRATTYPCFDRPVLSDLVDAKGLSWRYYQYGLGQGLWKAFDSIEHVRYGTDYRNVVTPPQKVLNDVADGDLANVVWVTPQGHFSDHSGSGYGGGPAWVAAVVNAIGKSKYWNSTAIFITWDDWGGWFDHVKPPILNSYELGFRVPLIVVSP
ncbi:MAG TPA: alkaline phosphatase family protein, partial [Candidatus Tumulicola sp.]